MLLLVVTFTHFERQLSFDPATGEIIKNKKGEPVKRLVAVKEKASAQYLVNYLSNLLPEIVYHRNLLRLLRNVKSTFINSYNCAYIDVDFSENLTIGLQKEPQSLHWLRKQVTVHSAIVKANDKKMYHPFVSDTQTHDQVFVRAALEEMLSVTDISQHEMLMIESDNCTGQYKSTQHFHDLQEICNSIEKPLVRLYAVEGHGKGEVDHVGGVAKVAVRREVSSGTVFDNSKEIVTFLRDKFSDKESPRNVVEIEVGLLNERREAARRKVFNTVDGSSKFHVLLFRPNQTTFKAALRLCVCDHTIQVGELFYGFSRSLKQIVSK